MKEKFIKFTETTPNCVIDHYINPIFITSFVSYLNGVKIRTMDGEQHIVDQSIEEVIKAIKDSDKFSLITK